MRMKFKRKILSTKKIKKNKFKRKSKTHKLHIQCESTGGIIANQNLQEKMQEIIETINEKLKKEPILELLPENIYQNKYL